MPEVCRSGACGTWVLGGSCGHWFAGRVNSGGTARNPSGARLCGRTVAPLFRERGFGFEPRFALQVRWVFARFQLLTAVEPRFALRVTWVCARVTVRVGVAESMEASEMAQDASSSILHI